MTDVPRSIELEVEVPGTAQEVWRAVATGPGISSWYVPHTVEERSGGAAMASFGPEPEMQIPGRVTAWEPPRRVCFDGGEGVEGLAFEWTVTPRGDDRCVVRLVNSGFGHGGEWDAQYDAMVEGWGLFLCNLRLHLEHFAGQTAVSVLPTAMTDRPRHGAWAALTAALGIPSTPTVGDRLEAGGSGVPPLAGTVVDAAPQRIALLLDQPAPGTAFLVVESFGEHSGGSVWLYLYGSGAAGTADRDGPRWQQFLTDVIGGGG
ncbi:SRPBCC family protein [Candidatus Poriferisocius sp.]|uniref:SRPBCC family protein n=1 Tax=Candidatus Poriferisocius sp. TaxID=3101276 RepID=UPI003B5A020E